MNNSEVDFVKAFAYFLFLKNGNGETFEEFKEKLRESKAGLSSEYFNAVMEVASKAKVCLGFKKLVFSTDEPKPEEIVIT